MKSLDVVGLCIRYADTGRGVPVLLAHCSSASHKQWSALADELAGRYRVVAPDLIGYGRSDRWHEGRPFDPTADADAIVALADAIGGRLHLAGHSYGGAMALEAARMLGDRVISLTLVEPVSFHVLELAGRQEEWRDILAVARATRRAVERGKHRKAAAVYMGFWVGRARWLFMPRRLRAGIIGTIEKVAQEFDAMERAPTRLADYASIDVPARLIVGERTRQPARAVTEVLAGLLPRATVEEVPGASHMSPFTHRDVVNRLVAGHIDEHGIVAR